MHLNTHKCKNFTQTSKAYTTKKLFTRRKLMLLSTNKKIPLIKSFNMFCTANQCVISKYGNLKRSSM